VATDGITDRPDLVDLLPVGVVQLDHAGRLLRANRAAAALLGSAPVRVAGRRIGTSEWQLVGEDGHAVLARLLREADGGPPQQPIELRHMDGRRLFIRALVERVQVADPEVAYLVVATDVTAEHLLELESREREQQYRILADHVGDAVLVHRDRRVAWASPSVRWTLGLEPEQLIGRSLEELAHPDDVADLPDLNPDGPPVLQRTRMRHGDGEWHWYQATVTGRWDDDRQLVEVYACLREIDDQVRAEQAVADNERTLRLAIDASPDDFSVYRAVRGPGGEITGLTVLALNASALARFARPSQDPIGREIRDAMPAAVVSEVYDLLVRVLESGTSTRIRQRLSVQPGRPPRIVDATISPMDADRVLATWQDVTEALDQEQLLERAYEETAEMRATLQTALDATSDGFAIYQLEWGQDGELAGMRVVHTNAAGAASLALDPVDMIGMDLREFFPEVHSTGLWERIQVAAVTKEPQHHRVHMFDQDGNWDSSWDNTVAPVGEERMAITWRNASPEETALRQLARTRDEAMYSATHDALTDLPNRVLLHQHLQEALRSCPPDERVGIVFVDLDRFKAVNDTYGHAAGDAVLRATAARLGRLIRHGDLAARLAGDEFVLVLTRLTADWAGDQFFARASAALAAPIQVDGVELHPSASLGAVLADPLTTASSVEELIKASDAAMYQAKATRSHFLVTVD
jgi:diguanylate cyclase (GGDEF)-like protein/PAS domain S-box-containing protein